MVNFLYKYISVFNATYYLVYITLTYGATILAKQTTPDDGHIRQKHVVRRKGD
jgi:hypothetical protein